MTIKSLSSQKFLITLLTGNKKSNHQQHKQVSFLIYFLLLNAFTQLLFSLPYWYTFSYNCLLWLQLIKNESTIEKQNDVDVWLVAVTVLLLKVVWLQYNFEYSLYIFIFINSQPAKVDSTNTPKSCLLFHKLQQTIKILLQLILLFVDDVFSSQ
jgi:hypothetical protein